MKVRLMLTCLCDAYFGEVGIATVKVLEHAGCEVIFDEHQTCCGQPPFNSGDWESARRVAERCQSILFPPPHPNPLPLGSGGEGAISLPVVAPSGSCTAMIRDGYPMLFGAEPTGEAFELSEFLVLKMGLSEWKSAKPYPKKVAYHRACHGRGIGLTGEAEQLLTSIPGLELAPFTDPGQCCGFGGAFCVTEGKLSSEIGLEKLKNVIASGAEELVSGDMGCLMHLNGLIQRHNLKLRTRHFAEILAEVIS